LGIYLAIFMVTLVLERGVRATQLQYLNRMLGAGLAVVKVVLVLGAIAYGLERMPGEPAKQVLENSALAPLLAQGVERAVALIPDEYKNEWLKSWQQVQQSLPATHIRPPSTHIGPR